jgi:hypothetical protein
MIVDFCHNCCHTGKCPPVLPVVCTAIAGLAACVCCAAQGFLLFLWLVGAGAFFQSNGIAFYTAALALILDVPIVATYAWRQEMRFRTWYVVHAFPLVTFDSVLSHLTVSLLSLLPTFAILILLDHPSVSAVPAANTAAPTAEAVGREREREREKIGRAHV